MIGSLNVTAGNVTYSSYGRTGVNSSNQSTVQSDAAFIDIQNGLDLYNKNTYLNLNNLSSADFRGRDLTLCIKYKYDNNTSQNDRLFAFCLSYTSGLSSFLNLAYSNSKNNIAYYEGTTRIIDGEYGSVSLNTIYYFFLQFSYNSASGQNTVTSYVYNSNGTVNSTGTISNTVTSNTALNGYTNFAIARQMFASNSACAITLYYANLLPIALTNTQMVNISNGGVI
jgi:hypothetical protein